MERYLQNITKADELQAKYGLVETLKDLYALEMITEDEAIAIQHYRDETLPKYTGDFETDSRLQEEYYNQQNLSEDDLTNSDVIKLMIKGYLDLGEGLVLQKLREN